MDRSNRARRIERPGNAKEKLGGKLELVRWAQAVQRWAAAISALTSIQKNEECPENLHGHAGVHTRKRDPGD